jgi:hypothetical protein
MCILPYNGWQHSFAVEREGANEDDSASRGVAGARRSPKVGAQGVLLRRPLGTPLVGNNKDSKAKNRGNTEWPHTEYAVVRSRC